MIEPYYGGSHRVWLDAYSKHSQHNIERLTMPAQFWKWRMQGGAVTMARLFLDGNYQPDLIITSDMMDLSIFRAITRTQLPIALYFHENQLSYPQNSRQKHGWRYGFINYASAMAADVIFFNSDFHMTDFFDELWRMLRHFPEYNELETIDILRQKASVLPLGLDLRRFDAHRTINTNVRKLGIARYALTRSESFLKKPSKHDKLPLILWNHRWEEEKNPDAFFEALYQLADEGLDFRLVLAGENVRQEAAEFEQAKEQLGDKIIHYGFAKSFADYAQLLWRADYVVSTSYQDFFGIAVTEAIYCGCVPLLANRLNYPHLLPENFQEACLFPEGELANLLRQHLLNKISIDTTALQKHIARYDWATMQTIYDSTFAKLV